MDVEFNLDQITLHGQIKPEHPGVLFREFFLRRLEIPHRELLLALGMNDDECSKLLAGKIEVTRPIAEAMSGIVGNDPEFWEKMQSTYNFWRRHTRRFPTPRR